MASIPIPHSPSVPAVRQTSPSPVLVGVCGSIAAYKSVEVVRHLQRAGKHVQVVLTPNATRFVGKATFEGLTRRPAYSDLYETLEGELHVRLAHDCAPFVVVGATADLLARLATGRASDLLTATALCYDGPLFVAPAMHPRMWANSAVSRNVQLLRERGVYFLGPVEGEVASGDVGMGRMLEPQAIVDTILRSTSSVLDLTGKRVVVSAGPTVEDIDPVRFISNRSTGRMGYAIAARAAARGAAVDLVSGPVHLEQPLGTRMHAVRSALGMLEKLRQLCADAPDAVIMAAAVGDFRVRSVSDTKLKRDGDLSVELVENPDIIATLAAERRNTTTKFVAFALETGDDATVIDYARGKLTKKRVDLVVANRAEEALGQETNRVHFVTTKGCTSHPSLNKVVVADLILDTLTQE
jgi:phosphopantothenoylcysteine decarboxylase / phosphopantothenate---cysteine ligase